MHAETLPPSMLSWFGLTRDPFAPDQGEWVPTGPERRAADFIAWCVGRDTGASLVLGSEGTGKSALVAHLPRELAGLRGTRIRVVTARGRAVGNRERELLAPLLDVLGVGRRTPGYLLYKALETKARRALEQGWRTVLVVDEAEALGPRALSSLVALWNLSTDVFLVQSCLVGRPEVLATLGEERHRSLDSRVGVDLTRIGPMGDAEAEAFLVERIARAGAAENPFEETALAALVRGVAGLPGALVDAARRSLAAARARGERRVSVETVLSVTGPAGYESAKAS
jgi:type II secretory pathway predicted ATPase ExeA